MLHILRRSHFFTYLPKSNLRHPSNRNDKLIYVSNGLDRDSIEEIGCNPDDKFTFLLHGWREDSETEWLAPMVTSKLNFNGYSYWIFINI